MKYIVCEVSINYYSLAKHYSYHVQIEIFYDFY